VFAMGIAAAVLITVTGCSDPSSTLRSNLEHRADSVKTSFAEALSKHGSDEEVANSMRLRDWRGFSNPRQCGR
jgi:hypothetical protein